MPQTLICLFFLINTVIWSYSLYYDIYILTHLYVNSWSEKLVMLTNINFLILTIHSYVILITILLPKINFLTKFRDFTFHTIIFPVAILTSLMFWGLYMINPELVMPSWAYEQIPEWINHVTHSYPFITVTLEIMLLKHEIPSSMKNATLLTLTAFTGYILILVHFYLTYNVWLYPIFHYISPFSTISILMSAAVLMVALSNVAIYLSKNIHSTSFPQKNKKNV